MFFYFWWPLILDKLFISLCHVMSVPGELTPSGGISGFWHSSRQGSNLFSVQSVQKIRRRAGTVRLG